MNWIDREMMMRLVRFLCFLKTLISSPINSILVTAQLSSKTLNQTKHPTLHPSIHPSSYSMPLKPPKPSSSSSSLNSLPFHIPTHTFISIILSFLLPLFIASAAELLTFLIKDSILTIANRLPTQTWIIPNHSHLSNHVFFNQHAQSCWIDCERHPRISNTCSPILLLTLGYRRHSRWSIHIKDVKALRWIKFLLSISYLKISTCSSSPC